MLFQEMVEEDFVTIYSNIQKKVCKKGRLGRRPSLGWTCRLIVTADEYPVGESAWPKGSLEITIGNACSKVYRLLEQCVETMNLEEESKFLIKLDENACLKIAIVLTSYQEKPYIFQWSDDEKIEASNFYKNKGTELFKENKIEEAFYKFGLSLKLALTLNAVLEEDDQDDSVNALMIALYNNLAGCQLHFKNYLKVIKLCDNSISIKPSVKALYRRAVAYIELKEYEKAENDLIELLKVEPKNKAGIEKYKLVRELDRSNRENYESIVKKMFT